MVRKLFSRLFYLPGIFAMAVLAIILAVVVTNDFSHTLKRITDDNSMMQKFADGLYIFSVAVWSIGLGIWIHHYFDKLAIIILS